MTGTSDRPIKSNVEATITKAKKSVETVANENESLRTTTL